MQLVNDTNAGNVEAELVVRCLECNHQAVVQSLQVHLQLKCPSCGGERFKAVPLRKNIQPFSLTRENAREVAPSQLNATGEVDEDFLAVKEVELGVYQINLDTLLDEKQRNVLSVGTKEGIYVIRLPFPSMLPFSHEKRKKSD